MAGLPSLNGGGTAAAVLTHDRRDGFTRACT